MRLYISTQIIPLVLPRRCRAVTMSLNVRRRFHLRSTELELFRPIPWVYFFRNLILFYRDDGVTTLSMANEKEDSISNSSFVRVCICGVLINSMA